MEVVKSSKDLEMLTGQHRSATYLFYELEWWYISSQCYTRFMNNSTAYISIIGKRHFFCLYFYGPAIKQKGGEMWCDVKWCWMLLTSLLEKCYAFNYQVFVLSKKDLWIEQRAPCQEIRKRGGQWEGKLLFYFHTYFSTLLLI